ncbi:hypothetical protein [Sporomusa malonica]|uniref:Uncharacterized protein n=1 Tax=Sporomusa malonica TaxID=112901 RepID=A0A1W2AU09_9FIRM|nr:hypothetical protein [Sporomusa malonica]SMC64197.1 hypothetical protein SAMN04488500_106119 [Sporomusa malonica]
MKPSTDRHQIQSIRWRNDIDNEPVEWSPARLLILIVLLIVALAV